ncbi:hypothetical protein DFR42_1182 [Undibacterium pigrum]|uniref:Uncharacterized protein n=1 Tax=Undibacterium pigrum TaxID=401470 RepID=A0A318IS46_9BURK|nr:hypothetical protein DFR42_1182 [Undibacterium pigrum]
MKYAWITRNKSCWPISLQCEILGVSQSGYHEHFARQATPQQRKHVSNDALLGLCRISKRWLADQVDCGANTVYE